MLARIADLTLDTLRTASIIQGRRGLAAILGFFEAIIYVSVVAKVFLNIKHPIYALAYADTPVEHSWASSSSSIWRLEIQ